MLRTGRLLNRVQAASHPRRRWESNVELLTYKPGKVESKWQRIWKQQQALPPSENHLELEHAPKSYVLSMFPYPSGRLHMGHVRVYTISDTLARYHRMKGRKVLHPMGWDSFGLPAENAAIERGVSPRDWTEENIEVMRAQLSTLGCHFDWDREISTSSLDYYKWTQWIFLQLYKHGLAYKKMAQVNWDPVDQTVLANEQVDNDGYSWRSGAKVEQKYLSQWFFKMSDYAEDLLEGLDGLDWPEKVKGLQRSWIGKSKGAYFDFKVQQVDDVLIKTFTTKPETVFGVSFLAVGLDHELLQHSSLLDEDVKEKLNTLSSFKWKNSDKKGGAGINLGISAVHPFTGQHIPIFAADFVVDYGTCAVMGVPGHDARDKLFAEEHHLTVIPVDESCDDQKILINSGKFDGMGTTEGAEAIIQHALAHGFGGHMTQYKLRDWLLSRQRYWGTPIPVMYCERCGVVPVPEQQLPVELPAQVHISGRGLSALARAEEWLKVSCGKPGCSARRETDTIDTFIDSSWYFLRYISPHEKERPFTDEVLKWMPVDVYVGGIEHAVLHLLYARFITHFLHNIGLLNTKEPFRKLLAQGMVLGRTYRDATTGRYLTREEQTSCEGKEGVVMSWEKMSKSKYNGADPQTVIDEYGADTVRVFMLFKAPPEVHIQWDIKAIKGAHRWLNRIWTLTQEHVAVCGSCSTTSSQDGKEKLVSAQHQTIKQVTELLDQQIFNVAIAMLMTYYNTLKEFKQDFAGTQVFHESLEVLCTLLAPIAPHISSELWERLAVAREKLLISPSTKPVLEVEWPLWSEEHTVQEFTTVVLQVNGIKKGTVEVSSSLCHPSRHGHLQVEALQAAVEQNIISNSESASKVYIGRTGEVVNLVV